MGMAVDFNRILPHVVQIAGEFSLPKRHATVEHAAHPLDIALHVVGLHVDRPQLIVGDELAARRRHADLLVIAVNTLTDAHVLLLPEQSTKLQHQRTCVRVDEIHAQVGTREHPTDVGQHVAPNVQRQDRQFRMHTGIHRRAGETLDHRLRDLDRHRGRGVEVDVFVQHSEHRSRTLAAQLSGDVGPIHRNALVVLRQTLMGATWQ